MLKTSRDHFTLLFYLLLRIELDEVKAPLDDAPLDMLLAWFWMWNALLCAQQDGLKDLIELDLNDGLEEDERRNRQCDNAWEVDPLWGGLAPIYRLEKANGGPRLIWLWRVEIDLR